MQKAFFHDAMPGAHLLAPSRHEELAARPLGAVSGS